MTRLKKTKLATAVSIALVLVLGMGSIAGALDNPGSALAWWAVLGWVVLAVFTWFLVGELTRQLRNESTRKLDEAYWKSLGVDIADR